MTYSWHKEYYDRALKEMVMTAGKKCLYSWEGDCDGWLAWFEANHSELCQKYSEAIVKIHQLWGNMDPKVMEEFKQAVKVEVDATKWAIDKFLEEKEKQRESASLPASGGAKGDQGWPVNKLASSQEALL